MQMISLPGEMSYYRASACEGW